MDPTREEREAGRRILVAIAAYLDVDDRILEVALTRIVREQKLL